MSLIFGRAARLLAATAFVAVVWPANDASAQEEVTVIGKLPDNCSVEDGEITCSGMPLDEYCLQGGTGLEDMCYGGGSSGGGGSGGGSSGGSGSGQDSDEEEGEEESEEVDFAQWCAEEGGELIDGRCEWAPEEDPEEESEDESDEESLTDQERCLQGGGRWRVTYCIQEEDLNIYDDCSCSVNHTWLHEGQTTRPACEVDRVRFWSDRDPNVQCIWGMVP